MSPSPVFFSIHYCPACGLVEGQLGWDVPVRVGECAGIVAVGTAHKPVEMEHIEVTQYRREGVDDQSDWGDELGCVEPYPEHDYRDCGGGVYRCNRCDAEIWEDLPNG